MIIKTMLMVSEIILNYENRIKRNELMSFYIDYLESFGDEEEDKIIKGVRYFIKENIFPEFLDEKLFLYDDVSKIFTGSYFSDCYIPNNLLIQLQKYSLMNNPLIVKFVDFNFLCFCIGSKMF